MIKFLRIQLSGEEPPPMTLSGVTLVSEKPDANNFDDYEEVSDIQETSLGEASTSC
jgi:hypothetical protein